MKKIYLLASTLFLAQFLIPSAQAKMMVKVKALGSSPKGQFIAFEEYGYRTGRKLPFSKIRIMNVWKNQYVETPIHVVGKVDGHELDDVRLEAKKLARKKLKKFDISI